MLKGSILVKLGEVVQTAPLDNILGRQARRALLVMLVDIVPAQPMKSNVLLAHMQAGMGCQLV